MKEVRVNPPESSRNTSHSPSPRLSQESPTSKSGALSYSVASNPVYYSQGALHVLFAGASQTLPGHALGPKLYDYYLLHYVEKGAWHIPHGAAHLRSSCRRLFPHSSRAASQLQVS